MTSATDSSAVAVEGQGQGEYGCTRDELKALMSLRGREAYHKIQDDYKPGGVLEICRRLQTSPLRGSRAAQHLSLSLVLFAISFPVFLPVWDEDSAGEVTVDLAVHWPCGTCDL